MKIDWTMCPPWAKFFVILEGGRSFWSSQPIQELEFSPVLSNDELPNIEDSPSFYKLSVLECIPRPEWKTLIHFKNGKKVATYEAEGQLTHAAVKRQLKDELGVDNNTRIMLEYKQIV